MLHIVRTSDLNFFLINRLLQAPDEVLPASRFHLPLDGLRLAHEIVGAVDIPQTTGARRAVDTRAEVDGSSRGFGSVV